MSYIEVKVNENAQPMPPEIADQSAIVDAETTEEPKDPRIDAYAGEYFKIFSETFPDAIPEGREKLLALSIKFAEKSIAKEDISAAEIRDLKQQARKDELTGLDNRRTFNEELHRTIAEAIRTKKPVSLIFTDIDNFKTINDTFGHQYGDDTLRKVATIIKKRIRESDRACRYGGEEITIILPNTTTEKANTLAEHLRQSLEDSSTPASFGVGTFDPENPDKGSSTAFDQLVSNADTAMYAAKSAGRNKVGCTDSENNIYILPNGSAAQPQTVTVPQKP